MELVLYIILCISSIIACLLLSKQFTLLKFLLWTTTIFIIFPSYFSYKRLFYSADFKWYFLSIACFLFITVLFILVERKLGIINFNLEAYQNNISSNTHKTIYYRLTELVIYLAAILYIVLGIKTFGGIPWLAWFNGDFAVSFRMDFWMNALKQIPGTSILRFLSKFGLLFLTLNEINKGNRKKSYWLLFLAFLIFTLEGTKSSLINLFFPIILYFLFCKNQRPNKNTIIAILLVVVVGTGWFGYTEANKDIGIGMKEKIIDRIFLVPSDVASVHFYLNQDEFRNGKTNPLINKLSFEKLDVDNALNYDNYVMRWYRNNILNQDEGVYGSMNAPGFIYGWVNFGFLGVLLIALFCCINLLVLDFLIHRHLISIVFLSIVPLFIIRFVTSDDYFNVFWGLEGIFSLLVLDLLLNKSKLKAHLYAWAMIGIGMIYNGALFLSRFV